MTALEFQKYERRAHPRPRGPEPAWASYSPHLAASRDPRRLSVVVPCRDHAQQLRAMLPGLGRALNRCGMTSEIVVVDCASRDESCAVIDAWRGVPGFRAMAVESGLWGVGAVARGLAEVRGEVAVVCNPDIAEAPERIVDLVDSWRADSVLAYVWRDLSTGNELLMSWSRGMFDDIRYRPGKRLPPELTSLCLYDRDVIEYLVRGTAALAPPGEYYGAD